MPMGKMYKATGGGRKRSYKKSVASTVKKVLQNSKEWKYYEYLQTTFVPTTAGNIVPFIADNPASGNGIALGDDDNQRDGDVIHVKTLSFRAELKMPDGASAINSNLNSSDSIRFVICYDKRPDGAFPAVTDVLNSADILSAYNHDNTRNGGRFRVLYDKTFDIMAPTDTHYNNSAAGYYTYRHERSRHIEWSKTYKQPLVVKYRDNGDGEVDDIDKGNIFGVAVTQQGDASMLAVLKVEYKDK